MPSDRSSEQSRRVLAIFESALQLDPAARPAFVREACGDASDLLAEVESLLASLRGSEDFLESPLTVAGETPPAELPPLVAAGERFGNFVIEDRVGTGGMGEVYRANDTRLGRPVAIKVLRADFADRRELRQRFLREARTISNLNHPNICTVYDVGERRGLDYLVMEYLDGETLALRLTRGPLRMEKALAVAVDIARGLEKAHEEGIVHRDLKPGNVMLTSTGTKVLDFGLAKPILSSSVRDHTSMHTLETREGTILGTPSYMSPQQARAEPVDRQTDLWAFGCILYEALTGKVAYRGDSYADTLVAVLERDPDWELLPPDTPPRIRTLLRRCLEKEPRRRLHDIADARIEIEDSLSGSAESAESGAGSGNAFRGDAGRRSRALLAGSLLCAVLSGVVGWWWGRTADGPRLSAPTLHLSVEVPPELPLAFVGPAGLTRPSIALSPDGTRLVYVAREGESTRLVLRQFDDPICRPIPGTEGAFHAFFAPDSTRIAFFNEKGLFKSPLLEGRPIPLDEVGNPVGGAWSSDDTIVYAADFGATLLRIPAEGGEAIEITPPDPLGRFVRYYWPEFLPDGRSVMFNSRFGRRIGLLSLDTGETSILLEGLGTCARYVRSGHLIYVRGGDLYAARMDARALAASGRPAPVLAGVRTERYGSGHYSISRGGTIAYVAGTDMDRSTLVWVEKGTNVSQPAWPGERKYGAFRLSPAGSRVAVEIRGAQSDIWVFDLKGGERSWRVTSRGENYSPVWTHDGGELYFTSLRDGEFHLLRRRSNGTGGEVELLRSRYEIRPHSLSRDGEVLLLDRPNATSLMDLLVYRIGDEEPEVFLQTPKGEWGPRFSPDGKLIAYTLDDTPRMEAFVTDYPDRTKQLKVSTNGGEEPTWSADGNLLFYRKDETWMAVELVREPELEIGRTFEVVTKGERYLNVPGYSYDYDPRSDRLLMLQSPAEERGGIRIITNWLDRLPGR